MTRTFVDLDFQQLPTGDIYKLIIGSVVPRPIAWVSTVSAEGVPNLAPFSFFNGVCSDPPTLLFCPVNHPDGREKDTLRNIRITGEFVVNIATEELVKDMNQTAAPYPPDVNEFEQVGLTAGPSLRVRPPRVLESPIQFECKLTQVIDIEGGHKPSGHVVLGRIVYAHVDRAVYVNGKISIEALRPIGRVAAISYCPLLNVFDLPAPTV
jgi:flavin reductase (DIM6/NTAB) family NADH-FMN oxidoreductase RutF